MLSTQLHIQQKIKAPDITNDQLATDPPRIVMIGAGPVGLFTAIELKAELQQEIKDINIVMVERHEKYVREQEVKLDISLVQDKHLKTAILKAINKEKENPKYIFIPIQILENCLKERADKLKIQFVYKQFMTEQQFASGPVLAGK